MYIYIYVYIHTSTVMCILQPPLGLLTSNILAKLQDSIEGAIWDLHLHMTLDIMKNDLSYSKSTQSLMRLSLSDPSSQFGARRQCICSTIYSWRMFASVHNNSSIGIGHYEGLSPPTSVSSGLIHLHLPGYIYFIMANFLRFLSPHFMFCPFCLCSTLHVLSHSIWWYQMRRCR